MKRVGVFVMWLFAAALYSQQSSVTGTVIDAETKQPLAGAVVSIEGMAMRALTDTTGRYHFTQLTESRITIMVRYLGYQTEIKTVELNAGRQSSASFALRPVVLPTQGIVIMATRARERETPISFANLEPRDIQERYTVQDMPVLLSELPSTMYHSESGNGIGYTHINIRGFDQLRISVMVNGAPQNDPEDHGVYWLDTPDIASDLQDVQVQRGAGSLMGGAPAIGGAINLVTSNYANKRGISLFAGMGSFNTRKYSIAINSGLIAEKYSLYARLTKMASDGYRENSWVDYNGYFLSAARFDDRMTTQINVYGGPIADHLAYSGVPKSDLSDRTKRRGNPIKRPEELENFWQPQYSILNELKFSEDLTLSNTLFMMTGEGFYDYDGSWAPYSYYRITQANGFNVTGDPDTLYILNALIHAYVNNHQYGWFPRLSLQHENGTLSVGSEVRFHRSVHWGSLRWGQNLPQGVTPDYKYYFYRGYKDMFSIYGNEMYRLTDDMLLLVNIQLVANTYKLYDEKYIGTDFSQPYYFINPKVGLNYNLTSEYNVYATLSRTSREPRLKNLYEAAEASTPVSWGAPVVPQYELKPGGGYDYSKPLVKEETMNAAEFGGAYTNDRLKCSANVYVMSFDNEIVKSGRVDRFGQPVTGNAKQTLHLGLELSATARLPEGFDVTGNATFSRNRFVSHTEYTSSGPISLDGKRIAGFPDFLANARVSYRQDEYSVSIAGRYVGDFYTTNREEANRVVDAYSVFDCSATYKLPAVGGLQAVSLIVQVNNIFDILYAGNGEKDEFFPAATRNYFVGLSLEL